LLHEIISQHCFENNVPFCCVSALTNLKDLSLSQTWYVAIYVAINCTVNVLH